jgi:hypothetical protein
MRVAPAVDQARLFMERGIDQVRRALELASHRSALRSIGEIERDMARAMESARLAPRQRDHLGATCAAEVAQCGVADQPGRTRDHHLLRHPVAPVAASSLVDRVAAVSENKKSPGKSPGLSALSDVRPISSGCRP